ncbi:Piwi domain-containing protein [Phakopsora pachyrhizi]|nr:Piwi domain-containing protein [Phakopsora pachyrhizi]
MVRFECHANDADRSGISQPGTIVDKIIRDQFLYNLFFQSQAGLNGTSCATRYKVLKDETNDTFDDPQNIANSLFIGSQRATKSVGLATPTYYANLLATRAKKWDISDENGSTFFTTNSGTQTSGERHYDKLLKRHFKIQYSIPENDKNDDKLNNKDGDGGD